MFLCVPHELGGYRIIKGGKLPVYYTSGTSTYEL